MTATITTWTIMMAITTMAIITMAIITTEHPAIRMPWITTTATTAMGISGA